MRGVARPGPSQRPPAVPNIADAAKTEAGTPGQLDSAHGVQVGEAGGRTEYTTTVQRCLQPPTPPPSPGNRRVQIPKILHTKHQQDQKLGVHLPHYPQGTHTCTHTHTPSETRKNVVVADNARCTFDILFLYFFDGGWLYGLYHP